MHYFNGTTRKFPLSALKCLPCHKQTLKSSQGSENLSRSGGTLVDFSPLTMMVGY